MMIAFGTAGREWTELVAQIAELEELIAEAATSDDDRDAVSLGELRSSLAYKQHQLRTLDVG